MSFTVLVDSREKKPWELYDSKVLGREIIKLPTGDYTLPGLENTFCIDRKCTVNEIANNLRLDSFKKELERMKNMAHTFFFLEATAQDVLEYPHSAHEVPLKFRKNIKISGKYLMRCLNRIQIRYGCNIIYAGTRENAQIIAVNLMEEIANKYNI